MNGRIWDYLAPARWPEAFASLENSWDEFWQINFANLQYGQLKMAIGWGILILGLVIFKISWIIFQRRKKFSQKISGFSIPRAEQRGWTAKLIYAGPRFLLITVFLAMLTALAEPFLINLKEEIKYVETRTRVDLRDVSGSMEATFEQTGKIKAQVAAEAHLKFLEKRWGKNDRVSLWVFSVHPYLIEDFSLDDELTYFLAFDAPWEMCGSADRISSSLPAESLRILKHRKISGEGGTELAPALRAIIRQFDEDEARQRQAGIFSRETKRAILIISDAEIADFQSAAEQFSELPKRKIAAYLIWIGQIGQVEPVPPVPDENGAEDGVPASGGGSLFGLIEKSGGKIFPVADARSLDRAYAEIDKLEKVRTEIRRRSFQVPLFSSFIFIGIISLTGVIFLGLLIEFFSGEYP